MPFRVTVPASTSNLGPGIDCLGLALPLYLTADASVADGVSVTFGAGFDAPVPEADNLFLTACRAVYAAAGATFTGVRAHMESEIPLARGLASSATAIVAGAFYANEALSRPFGVDRLIGIATDIEGHPDNVVPCALGGLTAAMRDESGGVSYSRSLPSERLRFILAVPDYKLSTAKARQAVPQTLPLRTAIAELQNACCMLSALRDGDLTLLARACRDLVFTPARRPLIPGFDRVESAALLAGATAVTISGAGPTLLAVAGANADAEAIAAAMTQGFAAAGIQAYALTLTPDTGGVRIEQTGEREAE